MAGLRVQGSGFRVQGFLADPEVQRDKGLAGGLRRFGMRLT